MNSGLEIFVARKYFVSKKSQRAINIISIITTVALAIGTLALVVVLSVFNGFEGLVVEMFNKFDPPLKASPITGKTITYDETILQKINQLLVSTFSNPLQIKELPLSIFLEPKPLVWEMDQTLLIFNQTSWPCRVTGLQLASERL
jgi:ABC-type lipoprotein release transport system permease subunit